MIPYLKYLANRKRLRLPLYLIFHVTYRCNAKCRFCFLSERLNQRPEDELSMDEIEALSQGLDELLWVTIGGGEPFLRRSLPEICALFARNNKARKLAIPTNASMPQRTVSMVEAILEKCPDSTDLTVGLSLDGIGLAHDSVRKLKGGFEKLLETHDLLAPLRRRHPNFSLGVLTTLSQLNIESTREIGDFVWRELDADWHTFEVMRGSGPEPLRPVSSRQYGEVVGYIKENTARYTFGRGIRSRVIGAVKSHQPGLAMRTLGEKRQVLPCYAGVINAVVDAWGNLGLCELRPKLGNLRSVDFDFARLWDSPEALRQKAAVQAGECYCTHCIFQNTSILFSPQVYPALIGNMLKGVRSDQASLGAGLAERGA